MKAIQSLILSPLPPCLHLTPAIGILQQIALYCTVAEVDWFRLQEAKKEMQKIIFGKIQNSSHTLHMMNYQIHVSSEGLYVLYEYATLFLGFYQFC